jgi:hypothetical protein
MNNKGPGDGAFEGSLFLVSVWNRAGKNVTSMKFFSIVLTIASNRIYGAVGL